MKMGIVKLGVMAGLFVCLLMVSMMPASAASPKVVSISTSSVHSIALMDDGTVWSWGSNDFGQIGNNSIHNASVWVPVKVDISDVRQVVAGPDYALALKNDGTVWGWGLDSSGNLGQDSEQNVTTPIQIQGLDHIEKLSSSYGHTFALKEDGTVWAWGYNYLGELGIGNTSGKHTFAVPVQVNIDNVKDVACGSLYTLLLKNDGTVWATGDGEYGIHGDGKNESSDTFLQVPISNVTAIAAGPGHALAIKDDGSLWSWGCNFNKETGSISQKKYQSVPTKVEGIDNVIAASGGRDYSLALKGDGTVWVWGFSQMGVTGNVSDKGTSYDGTSSVHPLRVYGVDHVRSIAAGFHTCLALKDDGTLWSWGFNNVGQAGVGTVIPLKDASGQDYPTALLAWDWEVLEPTQVLFDQPGREYHPQLPLYARPTASPTAIPTVTPGSQDQANVTGQEKWSIDNNTAQYIAAGDDGTLFAFDNNTIRSYDVNGKLQWTLDIPAQWRILNMQYRLQDAGVSGASIQGTALEPVYAIEGGYLYLYAPPNADVPNKMNGYMTNTSRYADFSPDGLEWDVLAISPEGRIAWTRPLTTDITAYDDTAIKATGDRIYVYHCYNETVLDKSGKVLFTIPNVSDPAAVDENGYIYFTPAVSRYWSINAYPIIGEKYADFRTPSNTVAAYGPDGSMAWSKDVGMAIQRQYVADSQRAAYGTSPLYKSGTLYVMNDSAVTALDLNGNVKWSTADNGYIRLFSQMPMDSRGDIYLTNTAQTSLYVIGPEGRAVCPSRSYTANDVAAASDGILYTTNLIGTLPYVSRPISNETLYDLPTEAITAYDVVNNTALWRYQLPIDHKVETFIDAGNAASLMYPGFYGDDIDTLNPNHESIKGISSLTDLSVYPTDNVVYVSFRSKNVESPVVLGQSRCVYSGGIYALNNNGVLVFEKPTGSFVSSLALNNSTVFFLTGDGKISSVGIGIAVAGGIAILAIAALAAKFFLFGSVTRARKRVDKNANRNAVMQFIVENPGLTMYELAKKLGMNMGTVRYHLFILGMNHKISIFKDDNKYVRYFPNSNRYNHDEQLIISLLRRETMSKVINVLDFNTSITNIEICTKTGLADSTVSKFVKELFEKGVVSKELVAPGRFAYRLTEKSATTIANLEKRFDSANIVQTFAGTGTVEAL